MKKENLYGVILAGGSGSRLWPLSREMYPKQLLKLNQENTLFQSTVKRLKETINGENIFTVTNIKHAPNARLQLNEINAKSNLIVEPLGRNTAPAIGLAIQYIKNLTTNNEDPIIIVSPSDQLIKDNKVFNTAVNEGIELAEKGYIVTFGIKPTKPDTGYGYISTETDNEVSSFSKDGLKVVEFKEKPDYETAKKYVESGTYFWNGGIFMFKASTMIAELNANSPEILSNLEKAELNNDGPTVKYGTYENMPDISIDYAVMEHSKLITLVPLDCGWNDMGSWEAIFDVSDKNENNNYIVGNVIDVDSKDTLVYGTSKLVSTIGLKNTVVVETEDAILVCNKDRTQDVKKVFETLKKDNDLTCILHNTVYRPWGYYKVLQDSEDYKTREIHMNPKSCLSVQVHQHRSEHWVVLTGQAKVLKDKDIIHLGPGDSIDIPAGTRHSIKNITTEDLKIIEIQKGNYLDENDITRFEREFETI